MGTRALRLLATHHVFVEVSPDVFANNSLSSVLLDTGKSTEVLFTQCVQHCNTKTWPGWRSRICRLKLDEFSGATGYCLVVGLTYVPRAQHWATSS